MLAAIITRMDNNGRHVFSRVVQSGLERELDKTRGLEVGFAVRVCRTMFVFFRAAACGASCVC